jgi:hypothetical protein
MNTRSSLGSALGVVLTSVLFAGVPKVTQISPSGEVTVVQDSRAVTLKKGDAAGPWTLMAVISAGQGRRAAVLEDFTDKRGHIVVIGTAGVQVDLPKSLDPSFAASSERYRGHTLQQVMDSDEDLLGKEILAGDADPEYKAIEACFPPIAKMRTYTFVGTRENYEKVGFAYGGRTADFDPAVYIPEIDKIRQRQDVWDGLVGGWLPAVRFVYPEPDGAWSELVAYAPMRMDNGNRWIQPVWYRVARIENNRLKWARYFDSYHPFPPRADQRAEPYYEQLLAMRNGWERALQAGMQIQVPDQRLQDMARHSLVRDMITRMGVGPKYGVYDKNYGGSEHDGFPDTFNADAAAMLEWGQIDLAGQYIDNYFSQFVRDDGSILYRGPETGQYGRMLTVVAEYANYGGNTELLLKNRSRIDGVAKLLLSLRREGLRRKPGDPAYGMISGWSEADACLDPDPQRYNQPYFSNSTEAARGFHDLGAVWRRIGQAAGKAELSAWGDKLVAESEALDRDVQQAIGRSILRNTQPANLPSIAGVLEPFDVAARRDRLDPQFRSYRPYMEMLHSGNLTREQVEMVVRYRAAHRDTILGVPTAYGWNTHEMAGFLTYGHGYGLVQHDFVREFLLTLYSIMAHQYTRGSWTAPETRNIDPEREAAPYCTPAQLVVPMMTRWMLVFEDPRSETLWLSKGAPREWLSDGKKIRISGAPTRWGRIEYAISSELSTNRISATVQLPEAPFGAAVRLRLRAPEGKRIQTVSVNGKAWKDFDAQAEVVNLPAKLSGRVQVSVAY